ncbi:TPA: SdiA-regulated domain-containing protein [Pseudomonas putida]|uniref:SdiA-regulated domain-containing protein n=1 Tax=Pseudomonas TaxID=286 RepID=UPI00066CBC5F|nr:MULTISPECIES: SdiA-regulated domain-containing protein [Pseudomonas]ELU0818411.1 SdiA-regulated domain-containing protein [Pseudomonas putida]MBH3351279.1 SdiA-regulated domain-containing protein [Pseudomonas putida]MBH3390501.1 SdiA-regulated domain-containing protein [Pseudomonas putida]MDD1985948.1 SdiA-regulated domain-containing protein [Pseudomonas putida]MDH4847483.1 DNA-binding protein [Pseudomonas sp. BN605]
MPSPSSAPATPKRRFYLRWPFGLAVAAVIGYGVAVAMHWDDRGALWLKESFESTAERSESVWLPDYQVDIDAKPLPGMDDDEASDLAFNPHTRTLFAVMGKNPILVELSLEGDVLRKIPLNGWNNPEGVAVLEDGYLAITDERLHDLTVVKVDAQTSALNHADFQSHDLGPSVKSNKGFEAIAWDPLRQRLVIGEERPPKLYTWNTDGRSPLKGQKQPLPSEELDLRNLSALGVDPRTGHLLVLSADSNMLLELDEQGQQVSFMTLLGGFNGLEDTIPRAEGVAMDDKGNLYMVSEPALFYRFRKN